MTGRIAGLIVLAGCVGATAPADDIDTDAPKARKALVIGVDGLRPDALLAADTPNLDPWMDGGVVALAAQTHPLGITVSGPGWASVLTGVDVDQHGVDTNDDLATIDPAWPTFLARAREAGLTTVASYHWLGILPLLGTGSTDAQDVGDDAQVGAALEARVTAGEHDLLFSHFDDVDHAGHASGFSVENPDYLAAIAGVDAYVGPALEAVASRTDEDWLVVLVTDHGGLGTDHSLPSADTRTIPLVMSGGGLPAGGEPPSDANHMDVAPTVLAWLGVPTPELAGRAWPVAAVED